MSSAIVRTARWAVVATAVTVACGAIVICETSLLGLAWPIRALSILVLALGVAATVQVTAVRPLLGLLAEEVRRRRAAEATLERSERADSLVGLAAGALRGAQNQAEVLTVVGRAFAELDPEREHSVLLASADGPNVAWRLRAGSEGLGPAEALEGASRCNALAERRPSTSETSAALGACAHGASEPESSLVCLPIAWGSGQLGVVMSTGPVGDLPDARSTARMADVAQRASERLAVLASERAALAVDRHDPLTGLPDRQAVHRRMRDLIGGLTPFCLVLCDLDGLTAYNARNGRDGGDRAIRTFADVLTDSLRPGDVVGRFGDDKFLALFPQCSTDGAQAAMERVRETLVLELATTELPAFAFSAGVADSTQGSSIEELVESAEIALLVAKNEGGNRVRLASFADPTVADLD